MLDRNEDMISSGGRHPFLGRYKVGFTGEGKITAVDIKLYSNGGTCMDLSVAVSPSSAGFTHAQIANSHFHKRICLAHKHTCK